MKKLSRARKVCSNIGTFLLIMYLIWFTYFLWISDSFTLIHDIFKNNFTDFQSALFFTIFLFGLLMLSIFIQSIIQTIFFEEESELDKKIKKLRKDFRKGRIKDRKTFRNKIKREKLLYKLNHLEK